MTIIQKKRILARFPSHYPLAEACKIINEWDPQVIKCGHVGGIPYVYAESKGPKFAQRVARYLKQGIIFEENVYIPKFDGDDEGEMPPMNNQHANNIDNEVVKQMKEEIAKLKTNDTKQAELIVKLESKIQSLRADVIELQEQLDKTVKSVEQQTSVKRDKSPEKPRNETPTPTRDKLPMRVESLPKANSPEKARTSPKRDAPVREEPVKSAPKEAPKAKTPPKEAEAPVKPRRKTPNMHIKPDDELPYVKDEYYDMGEEYAKKYQKISGINADRNRGFLITMGRNTPKQFFYPSTYGDMDKAYAAAKAYLRAKITEGGFGTDKEAGDRWLKAYHATNKIGQ